VPDWSGASWGHELGSLIVDLRPEHPHFDGPRWQDAVQAAGCWTEPREIRVTTSSHVRPDQLVDHVASISWMAALPDDQRARAIARVRAIIETGETPAELPLHVLLGLTALA